MNIDTRFSQVDLAVHLLENDEGFSGRIEFNSDLFNESTIEGYVSHFLNLLTNIAENPDQNISCIPILSEEEKARLLKKGIQKTNYKPEKVVHQLFEEAVEKWPDSPAVSLSGESLTYSNLNERANELAHHLISFGVKEDSLVGICMERSFDLIVGILAILKAGGGYLPIDLSYPQERTTFMLQDAGAEILLTQSKLSESLDLKNVNIILIDSYKPEKSVISNPGVNVNPQSMAYVIYTSGSTGKPKGVIVTHYNVVRLFQGTDQWFKFNESDVWTLFHSYAFDFSVWEIWGALLLGGRLVIIPQLISRDPESFYNLLLKEKVTVLNQTPSAFRQLVQTAVKRGESEKLSLRYIIFGGEALDLKTLKPWFGLYGDEKPLLINMYGITETTVHVTYRPLTKKDTDSGSIIGQPIPDLKFYILDKNQNLAPTGVSGEIYVGGAGVAREYLNRPQLTKERFIKNPFSDRDDDRLYRTGDLARYIDGDDIEYLGRIDHQIKIRGFRIELGEIEAVINNYADVKEAVVTVRDDVSEEKRIVAYLMKKQNDEFDVLSLRSYLFKQLPEYMVPSDFVLLEEFPLTASGKLDIKKLPAPEGERYSGNDYVTPQNQLEKTIAGIWQKYLNVNKIGIDDNFFDLGGHSLLMVKVNNDLKQSLKKDISIVEMYRYPTIKTLSESLSSESDTGLSVDRISDRAKRQKESSNKQKRIKLR
jgi:amino acid adenylation domain-containing protein